MPTLLEQCTEVQAGLTRAQQANLTRQELAALSKRAEEWSKRRERRLSVKARQNLVPTNAESLEEVCAANAAVVPLTVQAAQRLAAEGVQGLLQGGLWPQLLNRADSANEKTAEVVRQAWRAFVTSMGEVSPPAALERLAPRTPGNDSALSDYRRYYTSYQSLTRQDMPSDAATVDAIRGAVDALRQARARLTLSAPEAVRRFLDAVDAGGASLQLLTSEVLQWLSDYDDIARFAIRSRAPLR